MKTIKNKITQSIKEKLPFVVYNKPKSKEVIGMFQKNDTLYKCTSISLEKGFVFAPFEDNENIVLFPFNACSILKEKMDASIFELNTTTNFIDSSRDEHQKLVAKGIKSIKKGEFKKVVLSRKQIQDVSDFDLIETYLKLLSLYPNAFVYVWYHPKIGLWLGATPETLLKVESNQFKTMSLAGTQVFKKDLKPCWTDKEIEEQNLVTTYIVEKLTSFSKKIKLSETTSVKAGTLWHLRTDIVGVLDETKEDSLEQLIKMLHPTPAVCGLPKNAAKNFILKNENYNRSFYTGFLGELNMDAKSTSLFVNLRCMQIVDNKAIIYVGGGITKESDPEKEWKETVSKSNIMRKVL